MMVSFNLGELKALVDLLDGLGLFGGNYDDQISAVRKLKTALEKDIGTRASTRSVATDSKPTQRKGSKGTRTSKGKGRS